jgi:bile acid:Na+ symporter, BASS family
VLTRVADFAARWFAALIVAGGAVGLLLPEPSAALAPAIPWLLGVIMFGMGLTLAPRDFAVVARHPQAVAVGVVSQFLLMPMLGWGVGTALGFSAALLVGMVLVGSAPGGTASNVIVYLAKGDVALSVAMTTVSTLLAPVLTPLLVLWLAGSTLPVDAGGLFVSIVQVVLLPVLGGVAVRLAARRFVERILTVLPLVSTTGIVVVVAAVVGANVDAVRSTGPLLLLAVLLHNGLGLLLGYYAARASGLDEPRRRAISVEVGMQNSGLAATLATVHFAPLAALPAAIFSIWHNLSGATLASFWARRPVPPAAEASRAGARAEGTPS